MYVYHCELYLYAVKVEDSERTRHQWATSDVDISTSLFGTISNIIVLFADYSIFVWRDLD